MAKKENKQNAVLHILREEAEKILSAGLTKNTKTFLTERSIRELLHELEVYQVELEMQNDELRISQELLEKERMRFAGLFNLAPVGYFILDKAAVIQECNDTGLAMLAATRNRITGMRFLSFVMPEDSDIFYGLFRKLLLMQTPQTCQLKMRSPALNMFYVQVEGKAIRDPLSQTVYYYFALVDVTEKRKNEIEQRKIKEQLQMALTASSTGTWHIYPKSKKLSLDKFAARILGLKKEGFEGPYDLLFNIIHPDDLKAAMAALQKAMSNSSNLDAVFRIITDSGSIRYIEIKGHMNAEEQDENFFSGIIIDITAKKKQEEDAQELSLIQQKNILKAVIETEENERARISNALHDSVGQLLYAIGINLEKSGSDHPSAKNAVKLLNQAIAETRNISFELAPSILTDFGLEVALKEMIDRVSLPDLQLSIKFSGWMQRLKPATEIFIFRIIQELVNNIIKHSKATVGNITISRKKDVIQVKVNDNGIGFSTKERAHNASGFYSIKNRLALYNGTLKIDSKKNAGTTVTVKFLV
jgi:PAS domain S-box-containing protein